MGKQLVSGRPGFIPRQSEPRHCTPNHPPHSSEYLAPGFQSQEPTQVVSYRDIYVNRNKVIFENPQTGRALPLSPGSFP